MFSFSFLPLLALASGALAAPAPQGPPGFPIGGTPGGGRVIPGFGAAAFSPFMNVVGCPVSSAVLSLPTNQTALAVPDGTKPVAIVLGIGTQNYTCTAAGNYTCVFPPFCRMLVLIAIIYRSAGAVATLFDVSCLYKTPLFPRIQDDIMRLPANKRDALVKAMKPTPLHTGDHYFITNPITGTGISPKFAQAANGGAIFTTVAKKGGVKSPSGAQHIDWLQLTSVQGDWASTVFRVDTVQGQSPATCAKAGDTVQVPYAAKYWFYK